MVDGYMVTESVSDIDWLIYMVSMVSLCNHMLWLHGQYTGSLHDHLTWIHSGHIAKPSSLLIISCYYVVTWPSPQYCWFYHMVKLWHIGGPRQKLLYIGKYRSLKMKKNRLTWDLGSSMQMWKRKERIADLGNKLLRRYSTLVTW